MSDPITEIFRTIAEGLEIAKPFIDESLAQSYENQARKRIEESQEIAAEVDPEKRRDLRRAFDIRLCIDTGFPIQQPLSGTSIELPVECYNSYQRGQIELLKLRKILASVQYGVRKP